MSANTCRKAAAEDTRQRDLTRTLGQVECARSHHFLEVQLLGGCPDCKAAL